MSVPWIKLLRLGFNVIRSTGTVNPMVLAKVLGSNLWATAKVSQPVAGMLLVPVAVVIGAAGLTIESRLRRGEPAPRSSDATWKRRDERFLEQLEQPPKSKNIE
jgi:hypothetical protein